MTAIEVACPCGFKGTAPTANAGMSTACPRCKSKIKVPTPADLYDRDLDAPPLPPSNAEPAVLSPLDASIQARARTAKVFPDLVAAVPAIPRPAVAAPPYFMVALEYVANGILGLSGLQLLVAVLSGLNQLTSEHATYSGAQCWAFMMAAGITFAACLTAWAVMHWMIAVYAKLEALAKPKP